MGYDTNYSLNVLSGDDYKTDYENEIISSTNYIDLFEVDVKWYDWEKDMRKYSKKHPETVFELIGEGEDNDDLWKAYFKNGKMQFCKAKITYDEFNENELE